MAKKLRHIQLEIFQSVLNLRNDRFKAVIPVYVDDFLVPSVKMKRVEWAKQELKSLLGLMYLEQLCFSTSEFRSGKKLAQIF